MCRFNLLWAPTVQRLSGTRRLQNRLAEMQPTQLPRPTFSGYGLNGHLGCREVDVKRHWMLAFLIAGALVISAVAQDVNAQSTNTVVTQQQGRSDDGEHTIVVNVWSKSGPEGPEQVSSAFA